MNYRRPVWSKKDAEFPNKPGNCRIRRRPYGSKIFMETRIWKIVIFQGQQLGRIRFFHLTKTIYSKKKCCSKFFNTLFQKLVYIRGYPEKFPLKYWQNLCHPIPLWCENWDQMSNSDDKQIRTEDKFGPKF